METNINNIDANWKNVKNKCRTTVNKEYSDKEATEKFKKQLLISEHSPIRLLNVDWSWKDMKSYVSVHFSRHKWECFVSTQRSDRTGVNRDELPQGAFVNMDGYANAQNLIDTARKRLCFQASPETRQAMCDLKKEITKQEPEIGKVLVPNCIYRGGCPEFKSCGFIDKFLKDNPNVNMFNIQERYDAYNEWFSKTSHKEIFGVRE